MSQSILLLSIPTVTLFQPKLYQEINLGSAMIGGALEHHGFKVDFFDFNIALSKIRDESVLGESDSSILTDLASLVAEIASPGRAVKVREWLDTFVTCIGDLGKYDAVAISMEKTGYETYTSRGILHFANLLAAEIKRRAPVLVVGGGRELVKDLGVPYIESLERAVRGHGIDYYFTRNAHECFPEELKKYFKGEGRLVGEDRFIHDNSRFRASNFPPKYDIVNRDDMYVKSADLFPHEFLKREPRLRDADPITIVPMKHSMGCPYKCAFCQSGENSVVRIHEAEDVAHILTVLKKKGFENFKWYNDNLNLGPKFPVQLAEHIINANIDIKFSDSANMIHSSEEIFSKLSRAGCVKLWFGAETMSEKVMAHINKQATKEDFYRTLHNARKFDIWASLYLIIAFPHETAEDFMLMHEFIKNSPDLYDSLEVNIFRLLINTSYFMYPERYDIKLRAVADNGNIAAFDEIGGMLWEERVPEAERRLGMIWDIYPWAKINFFQNDYVLFSLLRAGLTKQEAKQFMTDMFDELSAAGEIDSYMIKIDRRVENKRRIYLGPTIGGRLVSSAAPGELAQFGQTPT